jgi:hypothetical protein
VLQDAIQLGHELPDATGVEGKSGEIGDVTNVVIADRH